MDSERSKLLVEALKKKGVNRSCSRCGHPHFGIVAETFIPIHPEPGVYSTDGVVVPTVVVACNNCGFVTQHALAALGVLPEVGANA